MQCSITLRFTLLPPYQLCHILAFTRAMVAAYNTMSLMSLKSPLLLPPLIQKGMNSSHALSSCNTLPKELFKRPSPWIFPSQQQQQQQPFRASITYYTNVRHNHPVRPQSRWKTHTHVRTTVLPSKSASWYVCSFPVTYFIANSLSMSMPKTRQAAPPCSPSLPVC